MKSIAAIGVLISTVGISALGQVQNPQKIVGPTYLASLYGMACDGSTNDTSALNSLIALVNNPNGAGADTGGGTIQLPVTGSYCVIDGQITWLANVNIEGCGAVVNQIPFYHGPPGCGLDLRYTGSSNGGYKVLMYVRAQSYWSNLAIKTGAGVSDCNPFFFIGGTVVHFDNVSITGSNQHLSACNDAFTLGANITSGGCTDSKDYQDCFYGYFSTFHHMYFANTRHVALFGAAANDIDWDYVGINDTNGCSNGGMVADCSAFEFNTSDNSCGSSTYGNRLAHIAAEQGTQGMGAINIYKYLVDFKNCAFTNFVDWIDSSDAVSGSGSVHLSHTSPIEQIAHNWIICGVSHNLTACVFDETGTSNYTNSWLDARNLFMNVNNLNAVNIGMDIPVTSLRISGSSGYFDIRGGTTTATPRTVNIQDVGATQNLTGDVAKTGSVTLVSGAGLLGTAQTMLPSNQPSGTYAISGTLNQTVAGGSCAPVPTVQASWAFVDLDSGITYALGSGGWLTPLVRGDGLTVTVATMGNGSLSRLTSFSGTQTFVRFKTGSALMAQVYQTGSTSCTTFPTVQYTFTVQGPF